VDLGVTYTIHLWLVGKRVVDFLLVLIELFRQLSRLRRYERIFVDIVVFERGWVTLNANFRGKGVVYGLPTTVGVRKPPGLSITWRSSRDPTFSRFDTIPVCDRQTD